MAFRAALSRQRRTLAYTVAAAALTTSPSENGRRLSIYPEPAPPPDTSRQHEMAPPSILEHNISIVRTHVEGYYGQAHAWVKSGVGSWIDVEEKVERRIKSFKSPSEPLTPGVLYVLTSTLFGTVLARSSILLRFTLPPALLVASSLRFLPETSHNVGDYVYSLEKQHIPQLAETQVNIINGTAKAWKGAVGGLSYTWEVVGRNVQNGVGWFGDVSGLKVREAFGIAKENTESLRNNLKDSGSNLLVQAQKTGLDMKEKVVGAVVPLAKDTQDRGAQVVERLKGEGKEVKGDLEKKAAELRKTLDK